MNPQDVPFSTKNPRLAEMLVAFAPSGKDPRLGYCAVCEIEVDPSTDFRDSLSLREWRISGLCQACQDLVFGES